MNKIKPFPILYRVTTNELKDALFTFFKEKNIPVDGCRYIVKRKGNQIELSAQVAFNVNSPYIETEKSAKLTTLGFENPYKMSQELINVLKGDLVKPKDKITTSILENKQGNRRVKRFIVELNPVKTLEFLLAEPPEGYEYNIVGAIAQKNNSQLEISLRKKKFKNNKNNKNK